MASISEALSIALAHHQAGRLDLAAEIYRRVLAVEPGHAEALHLAGLAAHQQGRHEAAAGYLERSIEADPAQGAALRNLAEVYRTLGRLDEAIECCRRAIRLQADDATAHHNLAVALYSGGRLDEAAGAFQQAIEIAPDYASAMNGLGVVRLNQGALGEAAGWFARVLKREPENASAHNNLAVVLRQESRFDEAVEHLRRALELKPGYHEARNNLGLVCQGRGDLDSAAECFERVLRESPDQPFALANLASVRQAQGMLDEALASYRRAMELEPRSAAIHSSYLNTLQYNPDVTLAGLQSAHAEYQRRHAAPLRAAWRAHENRPDPKRRLRVGFVSPNFAQHPVGSFAALALEKLDRTQCEVICYSDVAAPDEVTDRFRRAACAWHEVSTEDDARVAEKIRTDGIDVLFDLAGHTSGNRLMVFARRPAPVAITWLDYVGTTGLEAIDYLLADRHQVPRAAEPYYAERVLRMPDGYVCYEAPADAPAVGPLPALAAGRVTFGSFNNPAKVTPAAVAVWAEILRRVPNSRLVLKYNGMNAPGARSRFHGLFARHGIESDRVELVGGSGLAEHLGAYNRVDIALDTLPYNGGLTTCEALWMGVPVVTCPGETFASRHSLGHLSNAGFTETIAGGREEYVELAVKLAGNLGRLAEIRASLRAQVAGSPLCDGRRFADNLMKAVRQVWRRWCDER